MAIEEINTAFIDIQPINELDEALNSDGGFFLLGKPSGTLEKIASGKVVNTNVIGVLSITSPKPAMAGKYELKEIGEYPNLTPTDDGQPIVAEAGKFNYVYFDGTQFSKVTNEISNVTPEQTTFAESKTITGKNKANPASRHDGYYVNWDYGNIDVNASYDAFADIPVLPNTTYFIPGVFHYAWKKANGVFVSGENIGGASVSKVSPSDAAFLSFDVAHGATDVQLEEGTVATAYEPYTSEEKVVIPELYMPDSELPEIFTLSKFYWAPGRELSVFYDNVVVPNYVTKLDSYLCQTWANEGKSMQRLYRSNPTADTWFRVIVEDGKKGRKQKYTTVKVADPNSGSGVNRNVLVIGDSTVAAAITIIHSENYFENDVMNVTWLGTRTTGGVNHEGRPGWSFKNYLTDSSISGVSNAFFDGSTFNFSHYMSTTGQIMTANDLVLIQLGINDLFPTALIDDSFDVSAHIVQMKIYMAAMINSIRSYNSDLRIGIVMTIPPSIDQDATGFGMNNQIYVIEKYLKKGLKKWWAELLALYDNEASISNKIHLVPANMIIDRKYDFPTTIIPIDAYNSNTIAIQSDGIHLTDAGYKKIGDGYIGLIKYFG